MKANASASRWNRLRAKAGYTLMELTLAMSTGIVVAALVLALVNQQIAFLRIFQAQNFLVTEAPTLNNHISKIVGGADSFRLYSQVSDIPAGRAPVLADATALLLRFKEPDGTFRAAVIAFENPGTGQGLYYRLINRAGTLVAPSWALSKRPTNVRFSVEEGILRVRVTGPAGEELIYSGAMQL